MSTRVYPLPAPPAAVLAAFDLPYDVSYAFELCGLPRLTPADLGALREVLLPFVYGTGPETGDELLDGLEKARAEEDRIAGELAVIRVALVPAAPLDEDQSALPARGHGQDEPELGDADEEFEFYPMTADDIPALTATSFARLFDGARTEPGQESQR